MASIILDGFVKAFALILSGDPTLVDITLRSLAISGLATIAASLWSIPLGALIGLGRFRGRVLLRGVFNALLGVPTVTLGLVLYLLISKSGPLGFLRLLYTPAAIILGQAILVTPIIVSFVANTLEAVDPEVRSLALTLGSTETGAALAVLNESLEGVLLSVTAGFNRALAELGVSPNNVPCRRRDTLRYSNPASRISTRPSPAASSSRSVGPGNRMAADADATHATSSVAGCRATGT